MKRKMLTLLVIICIVFTPSTVSAATKTYNISINKKITLDEGKKCKLSLPSKYKNIKWSSNNKEVVTVSKSGSLTVVNGGMAAITAKSGKTTFRCYITVKEDYSEWMPYDTGDLETLADNIIAGNVVRINGQYYCSPEYFEMMSNEEIVYENDISYDEDYNRGSILTPNAEVVIKDDETDDKTEADELNKRIQDMIENGKATSD